MGYNHGYDDGYYVGYKKGFKDGYSSGLSAGSGSSGSGSSGSGSSGSGHSWSQVTPPSDESTDTPSGESTDTPVGEVAASESSGAPEITVTTDSADTLDLYYEDAQGNRLAGVPAIGTTD